MNRPCATRSRAKTVEVRSEGERRRRHGEQQQAEPDRALALDRGAERADQQAGDRHAERAGIGGDADLGGRDAVGFGQARQDRLGREQVDQGQEADHGDQQRAAGDKPGIGGAMAACRAMSVMLAYSDRGVAPRLGGKAGRPGAGREWASGSRLGELYWALTSAESRTAGSLPWLTQ